MDRTQGRRQTTLGATAFATTAGVPRTLVIDGEGADSAERAAAAAETGLGDAQLAYFLSAGADVLLYNINHQVMGTHAGAGRGLLRRLFEARAQMAGAGARRLVINFVVHDVMGLSDEYGRAAFTADVSRFTDAMVAAWADVGSDAGPFEEHIELQFTPLHHYVYERADYDADVARLRTAIAERLEAATGLLVPLTDTPALFDVYWDAARTIQALNPAAAAVDLAAARVEAGTAVAAAQITAAAPSAAAKAAKAAREAIEAATEGLHAELASVATELSADDVDQAAEYRRARHLIQARAQARSSLATGAGAAAVRATLENARDLISGAAAAAETVALGPYAPAAPEAAAAARAALAQSAKSAVAEIVTTAESAAVAAANEATAAATEANTSDIPVVALADDLAVDLAVALRAGPSALTALTGLARATLAVAEAGPELSAKAAAAGLTQRAAALFICAQVAPGTVDTTLLSGLVAESTHRTAASALAAVRGALLENDAISPPETDAESAADEVLEGAAAPAVGMALSAAAGAAAAAAVLAALPEAAAAASGDEAEVTRLLSALTSRPLESGAAVAEAAGTQFDAEEAASHLSRQLVSGLAAALRGATAAQEQGLAVLKLGDALPARPCAALNRALETSVFARLRDFTADVQTSAWEAPEAYLETVTAAVARAGRLVTPFVAEADAEAAGKAIKAEMVRSAEIAAARGEMPTEERVRRFALRNCKYICAAAAAAALLVKIM